MLTAGEIQYPLDFDSMAEAGTMLGSGAVIVIDDRCCMVQLGLRVAQFYEHESCGKCTPCREGTRWMVQILRAIDEGRANHRDLDLLLDVCDRILGKCLCPLGDAAAMPVASYVTKFADEYRQHVDEGGCPFGGESSLEGVFGVTGSTHAPVAEARVSAELVVVIDDREVVAKGTGIVEAALPRNRDPGLATSRGSGRRRLPDVPLRGRGCPLQACTMTAQDGMVVRTAQTSAKAAEGGRDSVLLVNHPLLPGWTRAAVPAEAITFRWGPAAHPPEFESSPSRSRSRSRGVASTEHCPLYRCALLRGSPRTASSSP